MRHHERVLTAAYLALVALLLVGVALPPLRRLGFRVAEHEIRTWDSRWTRRLEQGEALLRAGRYQEAASYLARLDRQFPARDVRHARDQERERLLLALGSSYAALGSKRRALEAYQRLAAFDPRNYRNYFDLASMSNRLLAGWAPAPEARDAFLEALRINPSHLPSVRGAIAYYSARAEFAEVVRLYGAYLDAYLRQSVELALSNGVSDAITAPVDGELHEYELSLEQPAGWSGMLSIATGGFSLGVDRIELLPPQRVAVAAALRPAVLSLVDARPEGLVRQEDGSWRAERGDARLLVPVPPQAGGIASLHLRFRLFKPVDPTTWNMVVPAFRNRLDAPGLAAARARTLVMPSVAAADSVLQRPFWARAGEGGRTDAPE